MAKSEPTGRLLTFNKAQQYLADHGFSVSTQQVRHIARTNQIVIEGTEDYTDPVTEAKAKVIKSTALDAYLAWREANPEHVGRGGNRVAKVPTAHIMVTADQLDALNAVLTANGFNTAAYPVRKPRKPKNPNMGEAPTNGVDSISSDVDLSELELIEVA